MPPRLKGKQRVSAVPQYKPSIYLDEYLQANEYVHDIIWALDDDTVQQADKKLRSINARIQKKNNERGLPRLKGIVDTKFFTTLGHFLEEARIEYINEGEVKVYGKLKQELQEKIEKEGYPEKWNLDDDLFVDICNTIENEITNDPESSQEHEEASGAQGDREPQSNLIDLEDVLPDDTDHRIDPDDAFPTYTSPGVGSGDPFLNHQDRRTDLDDAPPTPQGERSYPESEADEEYHNGTGHDDASRWQQSFVPLADLLQETEDAYGVPFTYGHILAWRANGNVGYSVIVGYECGGRQIARLEAAKRRRFNRDPSTHIQTNSRGRKPISTRDFRKEYRSSQDVQAFGLVAWRVDDKYEEEPTSVLRPSKKAWYPETYIQVCWVDGACTWESRDSVRFVFGGSHYKTDILIYRTAIALEGDYQEALTGIRPQYPDGGAMENLHWRNANAYGEAHWLYPRAQKDRKVIDIVEQSLSDFEDVIEGEELEEAEEDMEEAEEGIEESEEEYTEQDAERYVEEPVENGTYYGLEEEISDPVEEFNGGVAYEPGEYVQTRRHFLPTPPASRRQTPQYKGRETPIPRPSRGRSRQSTAPPMAPIPEIQTRGEASASRSSRPPLSSANRGHRDAVQRSRTNPSPTYQGRKSWGGSQGQTQESFTPARTASKLPSRQSRSSVPAQRGQQSFTPGRAASALPSQQSRSSVPAQRGQQSFIPRRADSELASRQSRPSVPVQRDQQSFIPRRAATKLPSQQSRSSVPAQTGQHSFTPRRAASELPSRQPRSSAPAQRRNNSTGPEAATPRFASSSEPRPPRTSQTNRPSPNTASTTRVRMPSRNVSQRSRHTTPARRTGPPRTM